MTSDLASEDDSSQRRKWQQRRQRRRAVRLIPSDEESVSAADNDGFSQGSEETFSTHLRLQANFATLPEPLVPLNSTSSRPTDAPSLAMTSEHAGSSAMPTSSVQVQTCRERNLRKSTLQKKILKSLEEMRAELSAHEDILEKLEMSYSLQAHARSPRRVDRSVLDVLPLASHEGLQELESQLSTAQSRTNLVSCLSTIGGSSSAQDSMRHIMRRCIQDSYAQGFSITGRRGKKPFKGLHLFSAIIEAVKKNFPDATDMMLRSYAADWLRSAPSRIQRGIGVHQRMSAVSSSVENRSVLEQSFHGQ